MSADLGITLAVLAATIFLFTREWVRLDVVALLSLFALLLAGILEPAEALAGFSSSVVFIIAGLFVVGTALFNTGVADRIGVQVARVAGTGVTRLTVVLMVVVAFLSAFMSSTGAVALFLPVVANLCRRASISPSRLLIPISFASLLGGMLTLIGTPPNIVVSEQLSSQGREPFAFFEFTPVGLVMLAIGVLFMVTVGGKLLPTRGGGEGKAEGDGPARETVMALAERYGLPESILVARVAAGSALVGQSLTELGVRGQHGVSVLGVSPPGSTLVSVLGQDALSPERPFAAGDTILVHGMPDRRERFAEAFHLEPLSAEEVDQLTLCSGAGFAEVLLPPRSSLLGSTLAQVDFRDVYGLTVLAAMHLGVAVKGSLAERRLTFGDTLLVQGPWSRIEALRKQQRNFVVVGEARGATEPTSLSRPGWIALAIMAAMMVSMTLGLLSTVTVILGAALLMVLFRCVSMESAYRSMSWQSLVVIAAMLPMASALEKTGGIELVAGWVTGSLGAIGPMAVIAGLFVLTSLFSQFVSNTATAVLVAPIAFGVAVEMGVSERAFLMTVAIAASTAFSTPIASPTNTLVLTPGGYRFGDYAKLGVPLQLVILVATVLLVPLVFPL